MSNLTRRFTYANVAATLALVFSMTGGALAASHYLVNSTKQINPKVLKALKGAKGPKGAIGAAGAAGPAGAAGSPGAAGATGATGRQGTAGQTVEGEPGQTGASGPTGPTGTQGVTGPKGEQGEPGGEGKQGTTGGQGATGATGAAGATGETGSTGSTGENGSALAYAHVSKTGELAQNKNLEKVELVAKEGEGIFCLSGITGTIHTVDATIDYNEAVQLSDISATVGTGEETCPEGTQVTVETSAAVLEEGELAEKPESQGFFVTVN